MIRLGPCKCQGCGRLVWWAKPKSHQGERDRWGLAWRDADYRLHRCKDVG